MRPAALFAALLFSFSALVGAEAPLIAIVGASVVHAERDAANAVDPDQTVILAGDRIVAVGPSRTTRVPRGATRIEARGKWLGAGAAGARGPFFPAGGRD